MAKKILVVDDDSGILSAFEAMLEGEGYIVETISDAESLYTLNKNNYPDLILLDVLLSGIDGRDLCQWLKNHKKSAHIPIIMISAHPSAVNSVDRFGADDFIAKPFEMDELLEKVRKYI